MVRDIHGLCRIYVISYSSKLNKEENFEWFEHYYCSNCEAYYTIFKCDDRDKVRKEKAKFRRAIHRKQTKGHHVNNKMIHQEKSWRKKNKEKRPVRRKRPSLLPYHYYFHHIQL
jgi:hypothetical protein